MRKECKLAVVLLFILLVFGACSETQSKVDNVNKNENRASYTTAPGNEATDKPTLEQELSESVTSQQSLLNEENEKYGEEEIIIDSELVATFTVEATSTPKPEKREWNGEAPSLADKWIGYYYDNPDMKDGDEAFVLVLKHNFSKQTGEGYFEAEYQYVYYDNGVEDLLTYSQNEWGSFSEDGGEGYFRDYGDADGQTMPTIKKAGLYFNGNTVEFGFCLSGDTSVIYDTLYLKKLYYE